MKLGQNFFLDEVSDEYEKGSCRVKNKVTRSNPRKTYVWSRDQIFCLIHMKLDQSVCLNIILYMFENGSCRIKSRSRGQVIEDPMLVTKGVEI